MADRDASVSEAVAAAVRDEAREAPRLHHADQHREALARAVELARAHPGSAVALNLAGSLHQHADAVTWADRALGDEEAAAAMVRLQHRSALDAFSAAARLAPDCVVTAVAHAEELAACSVAFSVDVRRRRLVGRLCGRPPQVLWTVAAGLVAFFVDLSRRRLAGCLRGCSISKLLRFLMLNTANDAKIARLTYQWDFLRLPFSPANIYAIEMVFRFLMFWQQGGAVDQNSDGSVQPGMKFDSTGFFFRLQTYMLLKWCSCF